MPEKKTVEKARKLKKEGKSPSTQAGEFVREQIDNIREGEHGARSTKQAIAIGLSEARRAGVDIPPPKKGKYSEEVRKKARQDLEAGEDHPNRKPSRTRFEASTKALKRESMAAATHDALSQHAKAAARQRTKAERSASAKKAAASRTPEERSAAAKKAAATRKRNQAG